MHSQDLFPVQGGVHFGNKTGSLSPRFRSSKGEAAGGVEPQMTDLQTRYPAL